MKFDSLRKAHWGVVAGGAALLPLVLAGCTPPRQSSVTPGATAVAQATGEPGHTHSPEESMSLHNDVTKMQFSSVPATLIPGKPAQWTLQISDLKTGKPVQKFAKAHDKLMHLIVASKDLSFYTHIHPEFQGDGKFTISYTLPKAGEYQIYADYVTEDLHHELAQQSLKVPGTNPLPSQSKLIADKAKDAWIVKRFRAHDEGKAPAASAPEYEVALMPMPMEIHSGEEAMLHFQIRDSKGNPLSDLMPYMGAMGHVVTLSADGKTYLHTHPVSGDMAEMMGGESHEGHNHPPGEGHDEEKEMVQAMTKSLPATTRGGPDVMFHTMFPKPGLYKVWGQFMHKGKVITADYTVNVLPAE